jgi:hypothetical protein
MHLARLLLMQICYAVYVGEPWVLPLSEADLLEQCNGCCLWDISGCKGGWHVSPLECKPLLTVLGPFTLRRALVQCEESKMCQMCPMYLASFPQGAGRREGDLAGVQCSEM